jgi:TolB protein
MFHQDISWSPDGKYLAFTGMYGFDEARRNFKADIFVMRVDGSDVRKISGDEKKDFYTAWAGQRVIFSSQKTGNADSDIYSARPDGSDVRQLTNGPGKNSTPSSSRDGKLIAFASTRDGEKYQIYMMNVDGSNVRRLTTDSSIGFYNPQFSPDGKRIVFYSEKGDGKDQVWVMNVDGSNKKMLTADIGHNIFPGWSRNGKKIIFSSSKRETNSSGSYVDGSYLYTINADGSALTKLGDIKSYFARFSPDGKKVAYISGKFPETAIYIANADGSAAVKVTK